MWELDGKPLRSPLVLVPVQLSTRGPDERLPHRARRERGQHAELLPAREAAAGARPRHPRACRTRRRTSPASTSTRRSAAVRAAIAESGPAVPGRGDRRPRDPAVREVPAVEGPRRALAGLHGERPGAAPGRVTDRATFVDPVADAPRATSTRSTPSCPIPADASQLERHREGRAPAARSCSRGRPAPASPDDHQPADPGRRRGQAGPVRRREARRARRRAEAARRAWAWGRSASTCTTRAASRPWCGRRSGRPSTTASTSTSRDCAVASEDLRIGSRRTSRATPHACTSRTAPACPTTAPARSCWPSARSTHGAARPPCSAVR